MRRVMKSPVIECTLDNRNVCPAAKIKTLQPSLNRAISPPQTITLMQTINIRNLVQDMADEGDANKIPVLSTPNSLIFNAMRNSIVKSSRIV